MATEFLEKHGIPFTRFDHPAVFTCEQVKALGLNLPGAETKNLFLRDGAGRRHFLLMVGPESMVDLKGLSKVLEAKGLGFGSPERLKGLLGVDPGSVTLLGVI